MFRANRNYKDSVFRKYFNDEEKLRSLYSGLSGRPCSEITKIELKTLDSVLYGMLKNDLAFLVNDMLIIIIEHQSTINRNMPLRMLCYIAKIYQEYIENYKVYKKSLQKLPMPEFYVLYNGVDELPDKMTLKLSDAFMLEEDEGYNLELKVQVININYKENHEVLDKCRYVREYAQFVQTVREYIEFGADLEDAIKKAIEYCKRNEIMVNFLQEYGKEVEGMLTTEFTMEEWMAIAEEDAREQGMAKGLKQGLEQGRKSITIEHAVKMRDKGIGYDIISEITGLTRDEIEKL